jgi:hypothetical protein
MRITTNEYITKVETRGTSLALTIAEKHAKWVPFDDQKHP